MDANSDPLLADLSIRTAWATNLYNRGDIIGANKITTEILEETGFFQVATYIILFFFHIYFHFFIMQNYICFSIDIKSRIIKKMSFWSFESKFLLFFVHLYNW